MSYLEEFKFLTEEGKLTNFLRLWEEYCMTDEVDAEELNQILNFIKCSTVSKTFGQFAETALPLWNKIQEPNQAAQTLRLILDLQTVNSPLLADLATDFLKRHYAGQNNFNEKMRIVGLLSRRSFQGAISNYELLTHMNKGRFVFHSGGWGVGEVMDISLLREHVVLEFEGISALKDLSFGNAFKHLSPLPSEHFLARRFGDPDLLEAEGKEDPISLIRLLLKDLGPKTAQEIKEELSELVIPEKDWSKWWGAARSKIKKDTKIKSPKSTKERFILRLEEVPHEVRFKEVLKETRGIDKVIQVVYNFTRDFPEVLKNLELKKEIKTMLLEGLEEGSETLTELSLARKMQTTYLLEDIFPDEFSGASATLIKQVDNVENLFNLIEIVSLKKRTLTTAHEHREDWHSIFLHLLFAITQNSIRDYIFKTLNAEASTAPLLKEKIHELLNKMTLYPEAFYWYFQKILAGEDVPYNDKKSCYQFLEAYLILLHFIEDKGEYRELVKKMYQLLIAKRYAVVRQLIQKGTIEYLQEILLLFSKCQCFTKHDRRIFRNLAEVEQPTMANKKKVKKEDDILWTTQEGYQKIQKKIQHIGTVETVDNAREIEAARALGDLRENSEYKFALERRSRLQSELHLLTKQLNKARIITKEDIIPNEISVGSIVKLLDSKGEKITYTLLGPWDADPDQCILSFQSKLAQAMIGCKKGETFDFQDEHYTIKEIDSYLE